ncbi:MAG: MGMT family protein, partial [bacterium]
NIKYGETLSYKELAVKTGYNEKYSRACATALSINKTPIILPCHRITASGGKLGGWSGGGGIKLKAALLSLEQNNFS